MKTAVPLLAVLFLVVPTGAQEPRRLPVILDTDIGSDIDDAFALGLLLASPELELRGVTTVGAPAQTRALLLCRFLTMTGRRHVAVAAGIGKQPSREIREQHQYYYHPDVLFNRTRRPERESASDFLHARLRAQPGQVTIVCAGPLTNLSQLITDKAECKPWIRRIIWTATTTNIQADLKVAQNVLASGVPIVVVPETVLGNLKLNGEQVRKIFAPGTALSQQMQALYQLWDRQEPPLGDVLSAALCVREDFCKFENTGLTAGEKGLTRAEGKTNVRLVTAVEGEKFLNWYVGRMADCLPPVKRPVKRIEQGGMPHRVHVAEDYDLDIERRWWMSGKPELKNLLPGSRRACRGVLTHDFDDLLGNPRAMHTAVIFNPVPGPPMGKHTRLSFRCWISGSSSLRVQIYSLTNGYHRHLVVNDLPQKKWFPATVDMTLARRPDGTGGPLSEGERIDDIQFYTDPSAELIIDDIVLYDAAGDGEKRPFPRKVHFTGWFDTGAQGREWPGDFQIIPDKGFFWKAARAVDNRALGQPWLRVHLRGERPLGAKTHLSFRYNLTGATGLKVALVHRSAGRSHSIELKDLKTGAWSAATVDFTGKHKAGEEIDEIHFLLPQGAELLLDDLLLFEPGE